MVSKRVGVVSIIVENTENIKEVNEILNGHSELIVGRMGIPYKERGINIITLIVDGSTDDIGSLTGKLGSIDGINVKSALSKSKK